MSALNPEYPDWDGLSANAARASRAIDAAPNFQDWDRLVTEVLAHQAAIEASAAGALLIAENLADLDDASAARTNLGLGTLAVEDAADYYTSAQTDTAIASAITALNLDSMSQEDADDYYTSAEVDSAIAGAGGGASLEVDKVNDNAGTAAIGAPVYVKSNGHVDLARANAAGTAEVFGLVSNVGGIATTATGSIQTGGTLALTTGQWDAVTGQSGGLTAGSYYYLDAATAGLLTTTAPSTATQLVTPVGLAHSTTEMEIRPERAILL